jgi:hypothetical protein
MYRNTFLCESAVNIDYNGHRNFVRPNFHLSQLKRANGAVCIPCKYYVSSGVFVLMEGKVLFTSQPHVTNKFTQNFLNQTFEYLWILGPISFHSHLNNLKVAAAYGHRQALEHVRVREQAAAKVSGDLQQWMQDLLQQGKETGHAFFSKRVSERPSFSGYQVEGVWSAV